DDYLVKPFQLEELGARLRAVIRRTQGRVSPLLQYRNITLDPSSRIVTRDDEQVHLSRNEYRTLLVLMERRGRTVPREQLEQLVYGSDGEIESNTVAVYIHQLRRKLGDDIILTIHGFGYRIGEEKLRESYSVVCCLLPCWCWWACGCSCPVCTSLPCPANIPAGGINLCATSRIR